MVIKHENMTIFGDKKIETSEPRNARYGELSKEEQDYVSKVEFVEHNPKVIHIDATEEMHKKMEILMAQWESAPATPVFVHVDMASSPDMTVFNNVLKTEYSEEFDRLRKNRMVIAFHKYGPLHTNYKQGLIDSVKSLEQRLCMYMESGNTEFLCDIANFAMIEFMEPQHPKAHFKATDDGDDHSHIQGMGINEIERFKKDKKE